MKILLIYTNKNRYLAPPPIGLSMIAESVAETHQVEFVDFMFEAEPEAKALQVIRTFQPDLIGLSVRILDDQNSRHAQSAIAELKPFVANIRQITPAQIVLGGTAFTTFPIELLDYLEVDYGIAGQGEKVFPRFVGGLAAGKVDESLPGLVYRQTDGVRMNPPSLEGYSAVFLPKHDYYDRRPYARAAPFPGIVLTKTGCPFQCVYCDAKVTAGERFRLRDPEVIVSELEYQVKRFNLRAIHLSDPCFNVPLDYAKAVSEAIIRSKLRLVLNTTIRPDQFDEELADLMNRAGFLFLVVGADTLCDTTLEQYQKGFTLGQVEQCCRLLEKHHLPYLMECVFGGPGETRQTVEKSLAFLHSIKPSLVTLGAGFRIMPETALYEIAQNEGMIHERAELLFPYFYFSPELDKDWLYDRLEAYQRSYGYRNARMAWMMLRKQARLLFAVRN